MSTVEKETPAPVAEKAPTKMALARALFQTIKTEEIAEGDSARKQFIARAQEEVGLTRPGAITYYNNLRNEDKGGKLYGDYGKKAAKAVADKAEEQAVETTPEAKAGDAAADAALAEPAAEEQTPE